MDELIYQMEIFIGKWKSGYRPGDDNMWSEQDQQCCDLIKNLSERSEPPHPLLGEVLELANSYSYTTTITPNYIGNQPYTKKIIHYDVLCKIIDDIQRKHFA